MNLNTAANVYDLQNKLEVAQRDAELIFRSVERVNVNVLSDQRVIAAEAKVEALYQEVEAAQQAIGGSVFCIARDNVAELEKRLASLNKKASKLGCAPITLTLTNETVLLSYRINESTRSHEFEHVYAVLNGSAPELPGFDLIAVIDHTQAGSLLYRVPQKFLSGGKIVSGVTSLDLASYRDATPVCDHCNKIRSRNQTFLVHSHAADDVRQIGRTCLKDYTGGNDPEAIAKVLEYVNEWMRNARSSRGTTPVTKTKEILAYICNAIRTQGYMKGVTKAVAWGNMDDSLVDPSKADEDKAQAIIDWATAMTPSGEFMEDIKKVCVSELADRRTMGLLTYSPLAYDKERAIAAAPKGEVDFIGAIKERITRQFKVMKIISVNSIYSDDGTKPLYVLEDEYGNPAKWFASSWSDLEVDEEYTITATVKSHDDHPKFGKSTALTRCKVA